MLRGYVYRIPLRRPDNWPIHVAGHPPGAVLFFVGWSGSGSAATWRPALVVVAGRGDPAARCWSTLRALGAEAARSARGALPGAVTRPRSSSRCRPMRCSPRSRAWGMAALALGHHARAAARWSAGRSVAGLLLGWCVMLSYGLPLLGLLALAVLVAARSWRPLPVAALAALVVVLALRRPRLRVVGGLPRPGRSLLGRHRARPAGGVLDLGQPGRAARRAGPSRSGRRCRRRARRRARALAPCWRWSGPPRSRSRRGPVPDVEGRGRADLAAVRALADALALALLPDALATVRAWRSRSSTALAASSTCSTRAGERRPSGTDGQARSGAVAKAGEPVLGRDLRR